MGRSLVKEKGAKLCVELGVEQFRTNGSKLKWQATITLPLLLGQADISYHQCKEKNRTLSNYCMGIKKHIMAVMLLHDFH